MMFITNCAMNSIIGIILLLIFIKYSGNIHRQCNHVICGGNYNVLKTYKRPDQAYTQGMFFDNNGATLFTSGGLYGESTISKMDFTTSYSNRITKHLNKKYFAEGIAKCGDHVYQLTWRENIILKYNYLDLALVESTLKFPPGTIKEGWGLTSTDKANELLATDGSCVIYVLSCANGRLTFKKSIKVKNCNDERKEGKLNDLAWADGFIYVNRYYDNNIYKINPKTGQAISKYDMGPLVEYEINIKKTLTKKNYDKGFVLNGIAYNKAKNNFLITGKSWGYFYEVELK